MRILVVPTQPLSSSRNRRMQIEALTGDGTCPRCQEAALRLCRKTEVVIHLPPYGPWAGELSHSMSEHDTLHAQGSETNLLPRMQYGNMLWTALRS